MLSFKLNSAISSLSKSREHSLSQVYCSYVESLSDVMLIYSVMCKKLFQMLDLVNMINADNLKLAPHRIDSDLVVAMAG